MAELQDPGRMKPRERYTIGWTDPRGMYSGPRLVKRSRLSHYRSFFTNNAFWKAYSLLVGVFILFTPIAVVSYWFWRWMGWL